MKKILLTITIALCAVMCFAKGYSQEQLSALVDSAEVNPQYALHWADEAISKDRKCTEGYTIRALAFFAMENYAASLENINIALKYADKEGLCSQMILLCFRGIIYEQVEEYDNALAQYDTVVKKYKKEKNGYELRAELYERLYQYDKAEADYRVLLTLADSVSYKQSLIRCLIMQDKNDEALAILNKIIRYQPKETTMYDMRAGLHAIMNNPQSAIDDYIRYVELGGEPSQARFEAICSLDYPYAIQALSEQIVADDEPLWLYLRIYCYVNTQQYELALKDLDTLEAANGEFNYTIYQRALCYNGLSEYTKEVSCWTKLLQHNEQDVGLFILRGDAYVNAGNLTSAVADYDVAVALAPDCAECIGARGMAKEMMGLYPEAMSDYNAALRLEPDDPFVLMHRGKLHQLNGDSALAKTDFERALRLDSATIHAYALALLGQEERGIALMQSIVDESDNKKRDYYDLACLYALLNRKAEAVEALRQAIQHGYKNYNHILYDRDLTSIREEQGYKELMADLRKSKISTMFDKLSSVQ